MLEVWGRNNSVNVQKVLWCCEELKLRYERIDAGGPFGRTDEPAYRALNPTGRVPTLVDNGFALWESNAITRYLARQYDAENHLRPGDPQHIALIDQWMDWQAASLWPCFRPVFIGLVRTPASERDNAAITDGIRSTADLLGVLDGHLGERDYVLGSQFTLADIPLGTAAHRWFGLNIERPALPNLATWYERLCDRPAYASVVTSIALT